MGGKRRNQLWFVTGPFDGAQKRSNVCNGWVCTPRRAVGLTSQGKEGWPTKKLCRVEPVWGIVMNSRFASVGGYLLTGEVEFGVVSTVGEWDKSWEWKGVATAQN